MPSTWFWVKSSKFYDALENFYLQPFLKLIRGWYGAKTPQNLVQVEPLLTYNLQKSRNLMYLKISQFFVVADIFYMCPSHGILWMAKYHEIYKPFAISYSFGWREHVNNYCNCKKKKKFSSTAMTAYQNFQFWQGKRSKSSVKPDWSGRGFTGFLSLLPSYVFLRKGCR